MKIIVSESQYKKLSYFIDRKIISEFFKKTDPFKSDIFKADLVKGDLPDFYKTLENAAKKGGLREQSKKDMTYQKEVESLQIGLILLGYNLSKYGVDGLFGPETAAAVSKFTKENVKEESNIIKKIRDLFVNEANVSIGPFKGDLENGPANHGRRAFGNWQSDNAWDLFAPIGTPVRSYTSGVVSKVRESGGRNPKVYGTQVTVKGQDGYPDIFYTHIENVNLSVGDSVNVGDVIGTVKEWPGHSATHVHVGLPRGYHLRDLINNSGDIVRTNTSDSESEKPKNVSEKIEATPEMIFKMIEMLKSKNITSLDVKNFTDSEMKFDLPISTGNVILKHSFKSEEAKNITLLIDEMKKIGITNPYTQIGILSVIAKESGFIPKSEVSYHRNDNSYIRKVFGKRLDRFSDDELTILKQNPRDFFNVVYAKTVGNQGGDDGWMYRGRGFNQLTGKKNYEKYGNMAGMGNQLVQNPDLLNDKKVAAKIALTFFTKGKPASTFPNFTNKEEAAKYFADINSGGGASSHRTNAILASKKFDVKDNLS